MIPILSTRQRVARVPLLFRAHDCLDETGLFALSYGQRVYAAVTRASLAEVRDQLGTARRVPSGMPRVSHVPVGAARVRALLVERALTQLATRTSELDHADWTNVGTPVVTANAGVASDGSLTLDQIADTSGAEVRGRRQTYTVPDDATAYVFAIEVQKRATAHSTGYVLINLRLQGGTTVDAYLVVDAFTGTVLKSAAATTGGILDAGTSWLIFVSATNNATGNTSLLASVYPGGVDTFTASTGVAGQGTELFGRAQVEPGLYPSSHVPRSSAAASRAAETIAWSFLLPVAGMTQYARWVELGSSRISAARYWQVGNAANANPRLMGYYAGSGNLFTLRHETAAGIVQCTPASALEFGDVAEAVSRLSAVGAVTASVWRNGGAEVSAAESAALALVPWSTPTLLTLGSGGSGAHGAAAFTHAAVAPAGVTRDELRDLCEVG